MSRRPGSLGTGNRPTGLCGGRFAIVFMDCQMPDMDGYEATRLIRQIHPKLHCRIIDTLTNTMQGDRKKCLSADMDDSLSKPLELADLKRALSCNIIRPTLNLNRQKPANPRLLSPPQTHFRRADSLTR